MIGDLLRRAIASIVSLTILLAAVFLLSRLTGDPTNLYLPLSASLEMREALREQLGLNQPILIQFGIFLGDLARLEFGSSLWQGRPALPLVLAQLPMTLLLAFVTTTIAVATALVLGISAALRPRSLFGRMADVASTAGTAIPDFWLALILILVFSEMLRILPTSGAGDWRHLILPVMTLAIRPIGTLTQLTRTAVVEQLDQGYVVTARAQGLSMRQVIWGHVLRNALIPVVTVGGDQLIQIANGAVVVEAVFGWPGIGKLAIDAVSHRDYAVIQATVFVVAITVFIINIAVDQLYAVIDPRIRLR